MSALCCNFETSEALPKLLSSGFEPVVYVAAEVHLEEGDREAAIGRASASRLNSIL